MAILQEDIKLLKSAVTADATGTGDAAKAYFFGSALAYTIGREYSGRNVGAGALALVAAGGTPNYSARRHLRRQDCGQL